MVCCVVVSNAHVPDAARSQIFPCRMSIHKHVSTVHPSSLCIAGEYITVFPATTFLFVQEQFPQDTSSAVHKSSTIENSVFVYIFQPLRITAYLPHASKCQAFSKRRKICPLETFLNTQKVV
jgi:hypothetical protein